MLETFYKAGCHEYGTITVFDYATTGDEKVDHRSVESWWDGDGMDDVRLPDYLCPRFDALMDRYRKSEGDLILAELILPSLGKENVIYLTVLLRREDRTFQSAFSAVRYG